MKTAVFTSYKRKFACIDCGEITEDVTQIKPKKSKVHKCKTCKGTSMVVDFWKVDIEEDYKRQRQQDKESEDHFDKLKEWFKESD